MELRTVLQESPSLFPLNWDETGDAIQFVRLDEPSYAAASFLDQRVLVPGLRTALIPWKELQPAATGLPIRCNFIFHISHAGSTLLSRVLGLHRQVFSLREPAILRWLAQGTHSERLALFLGLWSRVFRPEQTALIKATSFVSDIGEELMQLAPRAKAALMYVPLTTFLPSLLDGAMQDISSQWESRKSRLERHLVGWRDPGSLSTGEQVAASWLAEMLSLHYLHVQFPTRTLWLDFESVLLHRQARLLELMQLFDVATEMQPLLNSEHWGRYAKRPEVRYDTQFRLRLIQQGEEKFGGEIERGMQWLRAIADQLPPAVAKAVNSAEN